MRPLEIVIPLLLFVYLLWPLVNGKARPILINAIPPVILLITVLHFFIEGYRWQMIPIYIIVGIVNLTWLISLGRPNQVSYQRVSLQSIIILGGSLVLVVAIALPALLPVPEPLPPTGPYQIGTKTIVLVDETRRELYSDNPNEPRKFIIQLWYPAEPEVSAQLAPWMPSPDIVAAGITSQLDLPNFFLDHLTLAQANAFQDAPINPSGGPYPVLLFSHGWGGFRAQNTYQVEELASHGYIVVGMQHTYGALVTVFPDGQVAYQNPDALPTDSAEDVLNPAAQQLVAQWSDDMGFTLDYLESLQSDNLQGDFFKSLQLEAIGVFGHSTGGGATIQFCATDQRCKAGLPMDAYMRPVAEEVIEGGVTQPFLFMFSETWPSEKNTQLFDRFYRHVVQPAPIITILGTSHFDFSDLPMLSPLTHQLGLKGPLNGSRALRIINDYSLAFFKSALKNEQEQLLAGPSPDYPEVRFDR